MADTVTCPIDGATLALPVTEDRDGGMCFYVVITEPGTVSTHMREAHPEIWERRCAAQRTMNASGRYGMPRKVDGSFLRPGQDVGDVP